MNINVVSELHRHSSKVFRAYGIRKKRSLNTTIRIYSTCVLPVLLYGSESWTLAQTYWSKLQAFHMLCQRHIIRIKWNTFTSNDKVKHPTVVKDLDTITRRSRLGLFGHIARLPANVPAKQALTICCQTKDSIKQNFEWKRPRGRSHKT